ncbi:hypothetical protein TRP8649_03453 [Pelagimonas phthalicica]|uniref:Uncharacterized protein n=1 Tax=Pelagimonas phthalicica TaxID=1037362 RepID=A0A238JF64_9RHOB|nr:hypothetical protein CLV87_3450 [Pelagimonas phthalicica]SMX29320.1 hypothetical protein TRP8649_03453 [Pelagimonas phthalicica]
MRRILFIVSENRLSLSFAPADRLSVIGRIFAQAAPLGVRALRRAEI